MLKRLITEQIKEEIEDTPAVTLLGARQVGKTTLARMIAKQKPSVYLDLETPGSLAKLADPVQFLKGNSDKLIILDEIQHAPDLFMVLRGIIDKNRVAGKEGEQFLLLGSASMNLLHQSSESLAGRIGYVDMGGRIFWKQAKKTPGYFGSAAVFQTFTWQRMIVSPRGDLKISFAPI